VQPVLDWLSSIPTGLLYAVLAATSAVENVFPPIPADTVVAFGSFLAARGHGTIIGAFLATFVGNIAGAMGMYAAGRRYGAAAVERRLGSGKSASRLEKLYGSYGLFALFVSRFLPGVRALVPPFAGAMRIPPVRVALVIGFASAIWYGLITLLAFRVGSDWATLSAHLGVWSRWLVIAAASVAGVALIAWGAVRLRRRTA
jgi:membrane protein DedA with SNARE-associated domain